MEKENYNFLKSEYDKQVSAFKAQLEQKYAQQIAAKEREAGAGQLKVQQNVELTKRTFGFSERDAKNLKTANIANKKNHNQLFEQQKLQELAKFEKALEKQVWKDHGGSRLKAKEAAFGPADLEVKAHNEKLQKQKEQQQALEASRQQQSGLSKDFNREQVRQNIRAQFQDKGGKTR